MFGVKNLEKQVEKLEIDNYNLQRRIESISDELSWCNYIVHNPFIYKVGDSVYLLKDNIYVKGVIENHYHYRDPYSEIHYSKKYTIRLEDNNIEILYESNIYRIETFKNIVCKDKKK